MKIKKGDKVIVIAGKFKGTEGEVVESMPKRNRVVVEGVNVKKKALKKTEGSSSENFVFMQHPINVSNVRLMDKAKKSVSAKSSTVKKAKKQVKKATGKKSEKKKSSKSK